MHIKQLNESELELSENGKIVLLIGIVLIVVGIVAAIWILLTQDDKLAALIGVFATVAGVIALMLASNKQIIIRKNSESTVRQTRLISKQVKQRSFDARQASMVELEVQQRTETDGKGKKDKSIDSVIRLILLNDDKVELDRSSFRRGNSNSQLNGVELTSFSPMKSEAQAIADFLGIPLQVNDLSTLAGTVETLKGFKKNYSDNKLPETDEVSVAPKTQTAAEVFAAEQVAARIASNASSESAPTVGTSVTSSPDEPTAAVAPIQAQATAQPATALPQVDGQIAVDPSLIIQPNQIDLQPQQNTPAPAHVQSVQQTNPSPQQTSPPNTVFYPAQPQNTARVSEQITAETPKQGR